MGHDGWYGAMNSGDYHKAVEVFEPITSLIRRTGDTWLMCMALGNFAMVRILQRQYADATALAAWIHDPYVKVARESLDGRTFGVKLRGYRGRWTQGPNALHRRLWTRNPAQLLRLSESNGLCVGRITEKLSDLSPP